jgi:predicted ester cyclase
MTADLKARTLEGFERMFNQGDLTYIDEVLTRDSVDRQEEAGTDVCDHLRRVVTTLRTAFPDLRFEVHDVLGEGDLVATRSTMTGTHRARLELGPLAQLAASDRRVAVPHMHFFRWEGEHVAEFWHVWDTMLLLRQLGAPAPDLRIGAPV